MIQPKKGQTAQADKLSLVFPKVLPLRTLGYSGCALVTKSGGTRVCEAVLQSRVGVWTGERADLTSRVPAPGCFWPVHLRGGGD